MGHNARRAAAASMALFSLIGGASLADGQTLLLEVVGRQSSIATHHVEAAQKSAAAIYERIGVSSVWTNEPGANAPAPHITFKVVLVSDDKGFVEAGLRRNALGLAVVGTDRAYIFCDRIKKFAHSSNERVEVILGRVLAHEVGHLMLGEGHSSDGVMRAQLDYRSKEAPSFSPAQGDDIRERVAATR